MAPPKSALSRKRRSPVTDGEAESHGVRKNGYRSLKRAPPPARLALDKQISSISYSNITLTPQITPTDSQSFEAPQSASFTAVPCNGSCCTAALDLSAWLEGLPIDCTDACQSPNQDGTMPLYNSASCQMADPQPGAYEHQFFCQVPEFGYGPTATIDSCSPSPPPAPPQQPQDNRTTPRPAPAQSYDTPLCPPPLSPPQATRGQHQSLTTVFGLPTPVTPTFPALLSQPHKPAPWESEPSCFRESAIGIEQEALELSLKILQQWHPIVMQSQRPDLLQQLWDTENSVSKFAAMLFELRMQDWDKR